MNGFELGDFGLAHPALRHLVLLFPVVAAIAVALWARRRRQAARALGDHALVHRLAPGLPWLPRRRVILLLLAALSLGIAAAGPTWGVDETTEVDEPLADAVLVLDASNSMRVEDVSPNRLEVQKAAARSLLARLEGTRVGLVVFAGRGYIVSPLTADHMAVDAYLEALAPEMVPQGGSSLSSAIRQGASLLLRPTGGEARGALVLMSDGDALEEALDVDATARLAQRAGLPIHAVGIGTPRGGPVPDVSAATGEQIGYKREPSGEIARSALGEELLRGIAETTGGTYRTLTRAGEGMDQLAAALASGPRTARRGVTAVVPGNRYEWFVGLALALIALDAMIESGVFRWRRRRKGKEVVG